MGTKQNAAQAGNRAASTCQAITAPAKQFGPHCIPPHLVSQDFPRDAAGTGDLDVRHPAGTEGNQDSPDFFLPDLIRCPGSCNGSAPDLTFRGRPGSGKKVGLS